MFAQNEVGTEVNKLISHYFDAKEDYRLAASRSPDEATKTRLDDCVKHREAFHMQLQQMISEAGKEMSDNGTVAADLKRDWERLRGGVTGDGFKTAIDLAQKSDANAIDVIDSLLRHKLRESFDTLLRQQRGRLSADHHAQVTTT